jgi:hypothetical protein
MEDVIAEFFTVHSEYFLRIDDNDISAGKNETDAALYIISGIRKT